MKEYENIIKKEINFYVLFWLFVIGSAMGYYIEGLCVMVRTGKWECHAATLWGPFCVIYGIGMVVIYMTSCFLKNKNIAVKFLIYFITGALVEYFGSLIQEVCFGSVSWDYSSHFMNIGGRVSLSMALVWGLLGLVFWYTLYPLFKKMLKIFHRKTVKIVTVVLAVFMAVNLSLTSAAVLRWRTRLEGVPASNGLEKWIDKSYGNEKMQELFCNMRFIKTEK